MTAENDGTSGPGGFAITVAFELIEGTLAEFVRLVTENAALSVAQEPDCLRFDVLTPLDGASPDVLLYEVYTDRAAFERHLASAHYVSFDLRARQLIRKKTVTGFAATTNAKKQRVS